MDGPIQVSIQIYLEMRFLIDLVISAQLVKQVLFDKIGTYTENTFSRKNSIVANLTTFVFLRFDMVSSANDHFVFRQVINF